MKVSTKLHTLIKSYHYTHSCISLNISCNCFCKRIHFAFYSNLLQFIQPELFYFLSFSYFQFLLFCYDSSKHIFIVCVKCRDTWLLSAIQFTVDFSYTNTSPFFLTFFSIPVSFGFQSSMHTITMQVYNLQVVWNRHSRLSFAFLTPPPPPPPS